jgi:GT2 family glycosyltransferase
VRRADFEKIGPFAGIQFAEDIEWGQRARAAGCTFRYVPDMIVFHPARRSLPELYAKWDRHTQHFYNVAQNNRGWRIRWIARAFALLISPIVDVLKILSSDRIQGVSARFKATLVLVMVRVHRARKMVSLFWTSGGLEWNLDKKDL